jgi:N-acetyl-1-D-myo-inositol-2-amino-2-deoxy-alpha-D-glucopyranoside deacetylase
MVGTPANDNPQSFHQADLLEAAGRLAEVMREERPEVVITYGADGIYGHPDHIKAHQVTLAAVDLLRAEGWEPAKVYFTAIPRSRMREMMDRIRESTGEDVFRSDDGRISIPGTPDEEVTTEVDVSADVDRKRRAFAAHLSQNSPQSPFANMAEEIYRQMFGTEFYALASGAAGDRRPERDIFEGI